MKLTRTIEALCPRCQTWIKLGHGARQSKIWPGEWVHVRCPRKDREEAA